MKGKVSAVALGLVPLLFLPITEDLYDINKMLLLVAASVVILLTAGWTLVRRKSIVLSISAGAIGFSALVAASIVSLLTASGNRVEALMAPMGPVTFAALAILVAAASGRKKVQMLLSWILYGSAAVVGLIALYQGFGIGKLMAPGVALLTDPLWTPTGSAPSTLALLVLSLFLIIPHILLAMKEESREHTLGLLILSAILIGSGAVMTAWHFVPRVVGTMLPFTAGWTVMLEAFKNLRAALVGVGAENFVSAYTRGRPMWLNTTPLWSTRFAVNANFFLHISSIYGLLGLAASLVLARAIAVGMKIKDRFFPAKILSITALLLIPPSITILAVVACVLVLTANEHDSVPTLLLSAPWQRYALSAVSFLLGGLLLYGAGRAYVGELTYFRALTAAKQNEGTHTYNLHIQVIETNPYVARYHMTYSQTNIAIANALAGQLAAEQATQSAKAEEDQKLISGLIEQAIREAKIAVNLNAENILAWENLAAIYQRLIRAATGADAWAAAAYGKTIEMDPTNAVLMLNLGGIYVHEKQFDQAVNAFQQAIRLRPTYANAHYNLANAYRLKGDTVAAASALEQTLSLVPSGTTDYFKAKNELDALKNPFGGSQKIPTNASESGELTLPQ